MRDNFEQFYFEGSDNFPHESVSSNEEGVKEETDQDGCIKLKGNKIPKGLVSLEELLDKHDRYVKSKDSKGAQQSIEYDKINIGSSTDPEMVNIGKCFSQEEKRK
ncbi:hypothetical protein KI387_021033, partial [Taxus chinensis]